MLLQPAWDSRPLSHVGRRLASLYCCHQLFPLVATCWERPRDLSGSTQCLRSPLLCLHPTTSPGPLLRPALLRGACVYPPGNPALNGLSPSPFKILPPPLLKDGAKSHPKLTPYQVFPQYFTENTKQKCHFTRGVFFFSFRM